MPAAAEPTTILQAIIAAASAKVTPERREQDVARLLADLRIERVTDVPGRTWLHHPDYVDTIVPRDRRRRASIDGKN
jgi:hypothetical protein